MHPRVAALLAGGPGRPLLEIEEETGKHFHFEGSEALPIDHFRVALEGSREDVEERALPFQSGDEVLVSIEEPHMYAEDDAVAKLDGYVISVARRGSLVGKKTLVRIENVGRSAASATLVEGAEITDAAAARQRLHASAQAVARPRADGGGGGGNGERQAAPARTPRRARAPQGRRRTRLGSRR